MIKQLLFSAMLCMASMAAQAQFTVKVPVWERFVYYVPQKTKVYAEPNATGKPLDIPFDSINYAPVLEEKDGWLKVYKDRYPEPYAWVKKSDTKPARVRPIVLNYNKFKNIAKDDEEEVYYSSSNLFKTGKYAGTIVNYVSTVYNMATGAMVTYLEIFNYRADAINALYMMKVTLDDYEDGISEAEFEAIMKDDFVKDCEQFELRYNIDGKERSIPFKKDYPFKTIDWTIGE